MSAEDLSHDSDFTRSRPVDAFERLYFAVRAPLRASRWSGIDVLVVSALVAQTIHIAFQRTPGVLTSVLPSATVGTIVAASFLWRRRAPGLVALLSLAGLIFNGARVPVFFALYALAKYGGRHRFGAILFCIAAYIPLTIFMPGSMGISTLVTSCDTDDLLSTSVLMTIPVLSGLGAAAYEKTIETLHARERVLAAEHMRRAGEEKIAERLQLAREMHDILGHRIAITAMHAGALEAVTRKCHPKEGELARSIGDTARAAMQDLRDVLSTLRDPSEATSTGSKLSDLEELIGTVRLSGVDITFTLTSQKAQEDTEAEVCLAVYRITQESLTNTLKYAPGAPVSVSLTIAETVSVCIVNEKTGRQLSSLGAGGPRGGFGLIGLEERIRFLGGSFFAGPTQDGGWRVCATIPST
ncbi:sensor histidine kinase [Streptomyces sp. KL118A]|uniref:sensor histidine kinase n=1 Tax=Streptomyces sp. KL118A TaxID=3045153 RepID=UPI00278C7A28|nr:histidine kinase [Streptomyces sp. KL118A]